MTRVRDRAGRARAALAGAIVCGALVLPPALAAQAPALFGTWTVNLERSTFTTNPPPFKRETCTIEPWEGGVRVSYDIVGTRGGITHVEWTGRFDGRDYPVQGVDDVLTNAYRQLDDRTYDVVIKADGAVAATARVAISPDGQTITTVTTGRNAQGEETRSTAVFDRQ